MLLCDVGMMDAIPAKIARSYGADLTVAIDVGAQIDAVSKCTTAADILLRLSDIGEPIVREYTRAFADLLIRPDVSHQAWFDFSEPERLIEIGRRAARGLTWGIDRTDRDVLDELSKGQHGQPGSAVRGERHANITDD